MGRANARTRIRIEGDVCNVNTGGRLLYDIANNQITGSFFLGNVGAQRFLIAPNKALALNERPLGSPTEGWITASDIYDAGSALSSAYKVGLSSSRRAAFVLARLRAQ